jgi:hypothetical protein
LLRVARIGDWFCCSKFCGSERRLLNLEEEEEEEEEEKKKKNVTNCAFMYNTKRWCKVILT